MKDTQRNQVFPFQESAKLVFVTEMLQQKPCKGLLCLLNALIETVCGVSNDHHYDSVVKEKCKDWH